MLRCEGRWFFAVRSLFFVNTTPKIFKNFSEIHQRNHKIKLIALQKGGKIFKNFGDPDIDKKFWACCLCSADGAGKGGKRAPVGFLIVARPNRSLSCRLSVAVLELVGGSGAFYRSWCIDFI